MASRTQGTRRYNPQSDTDVRSRLLRVADDLVALARLGIQPTVNVREYDDQEPYFFVAAFGFGEHGNIHGCASTIDGALKELNGRILADALEAQQVAA